MGGFEVIGGRSRSWEPRWPAIRTVQARADGVVEWDSRRGGKK